MAGANALTRLNGIATSIGRRIQEEVSYTGPDNARTFYSVLTLNGVQGQGTGRSKKEAKHQAGMALLEKMEPKHGALIPKGSPDPRSPASPGSPVSPAGGVNYKGRLQEMMQKSRFPRPEYKFTKTGPPQFSVKCILHFSDGGVMEEVYGNGSTKKDAEADAARAMIDRVRPYINGEGLTPPRRPHIPKATPVSSRPVDPVEIDELVVQLEVKGFDCPEFLFKNSKSNDPDAIPEKLCIVSVRHTEPHLVRSQCPYDLGDLPIAAHGRGETEHQAKVLALCNLIDNVNTLLPTS